MLIGRGVNKFRVESSLPMNLSEQFSNTIYIKFMAIEVSIEVGYYYGEESKEFNLSSTYLGKPELSHKHCT